MLPRHSPHGKAPHLHASQFSSREIFYKITSAFLKTGANLRNLPPAHSRGAVTFSGLCDDTFESSTKESCNASEDTVESPSLYHHAEKEEVENSEGLIQ